MGGYYSPQPQRRGFSFGNLRWIIMLGFAAYAVYYYFSNQNVVPLTGRKQLVSTTPAQEAALGLQSYKQILQQENVIPNGQVVDLVRGIGRKLAAATGNDGAGFQWEFEVIKSDQVNAFCLPGGKVAVYTGILPVAKNEDGLAAIMGHEIAHAIARHGGERMAQQKLVQLGTLAAGVALSDQDPRTRGMVLGALGVGTQFGVLLPFSRDHESEADYMGIIYAGRACYDPREAPELWKRMGQAAGSGRKPAEFMSTHPSNETRIRQLNNWMPEALKVRQETCGK
jgi:metalloendopeptidase OMA1, mitochondrial